MSAAAAARDRILRTSRARSLSGSVRGVPPEGVHLLAVSSDADMTATAADGGTAPGEVAGLRSLASPVVLGSIAVVLTGALVAAGAWVRYHRR